MGRIAEEDCRSLVVPRAMKEYRRHWLIGKTRLSERIKTLTDPNLNFVALLSYPYRAFVFHTLRTFDAQKEPQAALTR
jgi:hypothetical protein